MLKKLGLLSIVFLICVIWFSVSQGDGDMLTRKVSACPVHHNPFLAIEKYRYTPDSLAYLRLAGGLVPFNEMLAPYKYRVLTPMLTAAATLVMPGIPEAMEMLTLLWLWLFYTVTAWTLLTLGVKIHNIMLGFLGVCSMWHLYLYHNPWSTDALYFLFASVMILAAVKRKYSVFLIALLIGLMNKETLLFLAPLWFFTDRKWCNWKAWGAVGAGLGMYLLPRVQDAGMYKASVSHFGTATMWHIVNHPHVYLLSAVFGWGLVWVLATAGAMRHRIIFGAYFLLTVGAFIASTGAADMGRMMASMSPAVFPAVALFFSRRELT